MYVFILSIIDYGWDPELGNHTYKAGEILSHEIWIIMASLSYLVYVLVSLLNPISYLLHGHQQFNYKTSDDHEVEYKALFVFGDSLFDPGNNQYLPNITFEDDPSITWPYGETFFHHPNGRLCDGRIVPDFIGKINKMIVFANITIVHMCCLI